MTTTRSVNDQPDDATRAVQRANVGAISDDDRAVLLAMLPGEANALVDNLVRAMDARLTAAEGKDNVGHRAQAIYDVLMARGLVSPLDGMRKLGVYHAILDGLLVKLDADGEPTQADANAIPLRASPCAPPEGNDALRALNEMLAWVDDGDNGALTAFAEAFDEWSEAGEMAGQAVFVLRERLIRLALPQAAKATAGDARPPSPPEGFGDRDALIGLIGDLSDDERCRLDHHGYCQTHSWMDESRCPHARARDVLRAASQAREASPPAPGLRPSAPPEGKP